MYRKVVPRTVERFSFYDYHFQLPGTERACTLSVSPRTSEVLNLTPGVDYDLVSYAHGLVILERGRMVFYGHTDYKVNQAAVPAGLSPVSFAQTQVLEDHYRTCGLNYQKLTNTEITFSLAEKSVALHQGQSGSLGDYNIDLLVARTIEYPVCYDCGMCAISFLITSREGQRR